MKSPLLAPFYVKRFSIQQNTQRHLRLHTTDQYLQCPLCGKNFSQKEYLSAHIKHIHDNTEPLMPIVHSIVPPRKNLC